MPTSALNRAASVHGQTTKKWYFFKGKPEQHEAVSNLLIFGGSIYPELSSDVCNLLGIDAGRIDLGRWGTAVGACLASYRILKKPFPTVFISVSDS